MTHQCAVELVALEEGLQFFSGEQAILVDAISDRLIPGDANSPGARQARTVIYIDRALAGYFSVLQVLYREGLEMIHRLSNELFGRGFAALSESRQDEILRIAENARHAKGSEQLALFFAVIREHTLEGMFGDPIHGGNHDAAGWRAIGFPGAQWGYSAEQMALGYDATRIPIKTLSEVQRQRTDKSEN